MRILIVGAGGTGGAFGTRLQEAGRDVTYLVRERRAELLRRGGLRFIAPDGDRTHAVRTVTAAELTEPYDVVIVAVKATAFERAVEDLAPAVGPETVVVPFLNGMWHVDVLRDRFPGQVLGGLVKIVATVDESGAAVQMTPLATITLGAFEGEPARPEIAELLRVPGMEVEEPDDITQALWEKWVFITAGGVVSCLFRNTVGAIVAAGGEEQIRAIVDEIDDVAIAAGHGVSARWKRYSLAFLTEPGSAFTTSLYRDLIGGFDTEAEHIFGDMAARARALGVPTPHLDLTVTQVRAHEIARRS